MAQPKRPSSDLVIVPPSAAENAGRLPGGRNLSRADMNVIRRRLGEGWTHKQIAVELGRVEGTIRAWCGRNQVKTKRVKVKGVEMVTVEMPDDLRQALDAALEEASGAVSAPRGSEGDAKALDSLEGILMALRRIAADPRQHPTSQTQALKALLEYYERRDPPQIRGTVELVTKALDRATKAQEEKLRGEGRWTKELEGEGGEANEG